MNIKKNLQGFRQKWKNASRRYIISVVIIIVMIVVSVLCFALFSQLHIEKEREEKAGYAAETVHSRLETMMEGGYQLLESMCDNGEISDTGNLLSNIQFMDLSAVQLQHHLLKEGEGRYLAYDDGNLYLVVSDSDMHAVIGEIEPEHISSILGSAFDSDYGFALFDLKTGVFLIKNIDLEGDNYFDCMLALKNTKAVTELLENSKTQFSVKISGKRYYIAQEIRDFCGIVLVIPEVLLKGHFFDEIGAMLPGLVSASVFVLAFIIWQILMMRHGKRMNVLTKRQIEGWRQMAETVTLRSNFLVFQLGNTGTEKGELLYYFNELQTSDDTELPVGVKTLSDLETELHVDVSETGKLQSIISGMKTGDVVETEIHCMLSTGVQSLHFELHCVDAETGHVFGCAHDCSDDERLERNEISENEFLEEMRPRSEAIAHIYLNRNKWELLYSRRQNFLARLFGRGVKMRSYDEDIRTVLEENFQPDDFENFISTMTSDALKTAFMNGKTEFSCDYRISVVNGKPPTWYRLVIRIWRDPAEHDLHANVFLFDVNEQKKAEIERRKRTDMLSRSLTAVGSIYYGLFYLDLISGICYAAKPYRGQPDNQLSMPYREMFSKYVTEFVHPDDQDTIMKAIDAWTIRKLMVGNAHLMQTRYRSKLGDGYYWSMLSIQAAQIENGAVTHAVITFQRLHNIDTTRCIVDGSEK